MSLALPDVSVLVVTALVTFLVGGLLAPLETLGWWAGWFGPPSHDDDRATELTDVAPTDAPPQAYLVFLSGIHSVSGRSFLPPERRFLEELDARLPDVRIVEVFPYSVTNRALTGQRVFARVWRLSLMAKLSRRRFGRSASMLINARNAWQVAVSADRRYGPLYDEGSARLIADALRAHGRRDDDGTPVILMGYSGGGQMALGSASSLAEMVGGACDVVLLGGVMASPRDLHGLGRIVDLRGRADVTIKVGRLAFPGRWPLLRWSAWNVARKAGRIDVREIGPMIHVGEKGYFGSEHRVDDGRTYFEVSLDAVTEAVQAMLDDDRVETDVFEPSGSDQPR